MKNVITLFCLLVTFVAGAQYSGPGFYRVHNAYSDGYICIKGTHFEKSNYPDAFWPCIKMQTDSLQVTDPGSIIYIDHIGENCDLCGQGVSTYSLTHLMMEVVQSDYLEEGKVTYLAKTYYEYMIDGDTVKINCVFRDQGYGLTSGSRDKKPEAHWWIEPVNEESINESYFGVKPVDETVIDSEGWYWTSMCCDFPLAIPVGGGVEGAYTVQEVECGYDNCYYAEPVLLCGQGDTIPAATPVLIKCKYSYASGNKLIPVGAIANRTAMPISSYMLQGNYFSTFMNRYDVGNLSAMTEYVPKQSTKASPNNLALGIDENGKLGFFPQPEGNYMAANTAWLNVRDLNSDAKNVTAVYLGEEPQEPQHPDEPTVFGDANGDGVVDVSDIPILIDYLLSGAVDLSSDVCDGADVNGDGNVDIIDISSLIDKLLTRTQEQ